MRIKNGEKEEDDLQLIDGLIYYEERMWWHPFTERINGSGGAVDMCFSLFGWLVADGWCWFVLREEYYWLVYSERKVLLAGS
jgi:hypothetical protein